MCQALARKQCGVSFNDISKWFDELQKFLLKLAIQTYLMTQHVYITVMKQSSPCNQSHRKSLLTKNTVIHTKQVHHHTRHRSVMLACSATGHYIPPLVVYPGVQPCVKLH